jgi:uncharacterized lipoprotein YddW (UPF0748 family)
VDQKGRRQPLNWYVSLNPCLPEVRQYLVKIMAEIATRYRVDGIHLDYIRFPTDQSPRGVDYPHDKKTLALFRAATGKTPQQSKSAWTQWRTGQVTQLLRDIRTMLRRSAPEVKLTAACLPDIEHARRDTFQDAPQWLREGLIDSVVVMNYTADTRLFQKRQETWRRVGGNRAAAGLGVYMHKNPQTTLEQVQLAHGWGAGFVLFSNNVLLTRDAKAQQTLAAIRPTLLQIRGSESPQLVEAPARPYNPSSGAGPARPPAEAPQHPYGLVP